MSQSLSRSLGSLETMALAFGAMIGWGWIVMSGPWLISGGTLGSVLAFTLVGLGVLVVAFIYAELAAAMPKCGGEHVYSLRALGRTGSFICTWAISMLYVCVAAFEAVALGTGVEYLIPDFKYVYLWQVAGYDVYLTWLLVGVLGSVGITIINVVGIKMSALFQIVVTALVVIVGLMLLTGALFDGNTANMEPLFASGAGGVISVVALAVFFFTGFDVIPQAAEEINLSPRKLATMLVASVLCGALWYIVLMLSVSALLDQQAIASSSAASSLTAADANGVAWGAAGSKLLILGGIAGIITSWNGFMVGGSRALYAMAESNMLPRSLAVIHPKFKTPYRTIILIGLFAAAAPFFGRQILVWITDAAGFAVTIAYFMVAVSFIVLRRREPTMDRPFKLVGGTFFGWVGIAVSVALACAYLPGSPGALVWPHEWIMLLVWFGVGGVLFIVSSRKTS
jgi:basic amino acid/polyamine antiporter, APA family